MNSKPTVNCVTAGKQPLLTAFDEAHADSRGLAGNLARQPLGAGPVPKTRVIAGDRLASNIILQIAMRAPAVAIFGPGQFGAATRLRAAGEASRIIRRPAVAHGGENIAAANLVAEEM